MKVIVDCKELTLDVLLVEEEVAFAVVLADFHTLLKRTRVSEAVDLLS